MVECTSLSHNVSSESIPMTLKLGFDMIKTTRMLIVLTLLATAAQAQDIKPYSPAVGRDFPTNVYFGDTHLHTSISLDAF